MKDKTPTANTFLDAKDDYGKKIKAVPKPKRETGIDTENTLISELADSVMGGRKVDMTALDSFLGISQRRDNLYLTLDAMLKDSTIAAAVETYAEDATEYNSDGRIVFAKSDDPKVLQYITYLIDVLQIDKHIYDYAISLISYGDVYIKTFRKSEQQSDKLFDTENKEKLNEDIKIVAFSKEDKLVNYIEKVNNPAEMFELTQLGKTVGYVKAEIPMTRSGTYDSNDLLNTTLFQYKYNKSDVIVSGADTYVHGALIDSTSRTKEQVTIFLDDKEKSDKSVNKSEYTVRRGQSLLFNVFKIWRELSLLENSMLLNRITKSAIVRLITVEVGDMPKTQVSPLLTRIKQQLEQKAAISENGYINEYTNPGPIENNIYMATRGGIGEVKATQVGGDVNVGQLPDIDYFNNKYYAALRIPKQFLGQTEDSTGFNGGTSLSIISSRYAKMVKKIQNVLCQMITDLINLFLIDRGLSNYIDKFTINITPPTTQEEIDKKEAILSDIQVVGEIMNQLNDVEDQVIKLKITKQLLSNIVADSQVLNLLDEQIYKLEKEGSETASKSDNEFGDDIEKREVFDNVDTFRENEPLDLDSELGLEKPEEISAEDEENELPTPEELGADFTQNDEFEKI